MKNKTKVFLLATLFAIGLSAQEKEAERNPYVLGFQLSQYQNDFGIGLSVTSPSFLHEMLAVKARGNLMFFEHLQENETVWTPYANFALGIQSGHSKLGDFIAIYGEGGAIGLFPSSDFSEENIVVGGYGLFGFEFLIADNFNYYIELGGIGVDAVADRIPNKPLYSNGFLINVGWKMSF